MQNAPFQVKELFILHKAGQLSRAVATWNEEDTTGPSSVARRLVGVDQHAAHAAHLNLIQSSGAYGIPCATSCFLSDAIIHSTKLCHKHPDRWCASNRRATHPSILQVCPSL